jgi:hypothetical protein
MAQSDNSDQELIQMIAAAIGALKPRAPTIAGTNSESRFGWGRTSGNDIAFLPGAPASLGSPPDEQSVPPSGNSPGDYLSSGMLKRYG